MRVLSTNMSNVFKVGTEGPQLKARMQNVVEYSKRPWDFRIRGQHLLIVLWLQTSWQDYVVEKENYIVAVWLLFLGQIWCHDFACAGISKCLYLTFGSRGEDAMGIIAGPSCQHCTWCRNIS